MTVKLNPIHQQFEKLQAKKRALMEKITSLSETQYTLQPSPGTWSVAQATNHIYLSEQLSLAYIRKKLSYPDTIPAYQAKSWLGVFTIKLVLWSGYKRKAPKAINMWEHQSILPVKDLENKWVQLRAELIECITANQPAFGTHLVYRHPFAGRMTMHQMLIFLNDHMAHHLKQIDRIIIELN